MVDDMSASHGRNDEAIWRRELSADTPDPTPPPVTTPRRRRPTYIPAAIVGGSGGALAAFGLMSGTDAALVGGVGLGAIIFGIGWMHGLDVWLDRRAGRYNMRRLDRW